MRKITLIFIKCTTIIISIWLAGCNQSGTVQGKVILYTSVPANVISKIETAFEEEHPNLDLEIFQATTGDVMDQVNEEKAAGQIKADILWVADFTVGEELKAQQLLLQYTPPEAEALLTMLVDKDGTYFAARLLNMVVAYNTNAVTTPPTGYHDLLDSRYQGNIGHASPASGSFIYFMGTLLQNPAYGETFFQQLSANNPLVQGNRQVAQSIADGELDIGLTVDFIVRNLQQENPEAPISFIYPATGIVMVPSPIAIFKDAPNSENAKVFERFILSASGQGMLRDVAGIVPVRLDVRPPADITSITQLQVIPSDPTWIRNHKDEIWAIFNKHFGE